jgi:hypothetical protein
MHYVMSVLAVGFVAANGPRARLRRAVFTKGDLRNDESAREARQLIRHLEDDLELADEIEDGQTGFLIERALDQARARQFTPIR